MSWRIQKVTVFSITLSAVSMYVGFSAWRVMFNNYAVDVFAADATQVGIIQAVREIPGLLAFGVGILAVIFAESRIAALSVVLAGAGLVVAGMAQSLWILGLATLMMSFGFHYFMPTNSSQLLLLSKSEELGRAQGKLSSFQSLASLFGAGLVLVLTLFIDYRQTFFLIGGAVALVGLYLTFALPSNRTDTESRKTRLKKDYWLYYTLSFLRGCRRHIFTTFAIFLLVKHHGLSITAVSALMLVTFGINVFTFRILGNLTDKIGERRILAGSSAILVLIFSGYAWIEYIPVLIGFYLIDNVLFGSSIALKSYVRKIAPPADVTGCLSFGMTANHITAVIIPVAGGVVWNLFGHEVTFMAGAAIVLIDMFFALAVPSNPEPRPEVLSEP
jgi:predicted MFS family arabinose efflux permease